jgi:hypothetical protein
MTCIAADNRPKLARIVLDEQHGDVVVYGAFQLPGCSQLGNVGGAVVAPVHSEGRFSDTPSQTARRQILHGLTGHGNHLPFERLVVLLFQPMLFFIEQEIRSMTHHRTGVRVRGTYGD